MAASPFERESEAVIKFAVGLLFVALNYYVYTSFATDEVIPERKPFAEFPMDVGEWHCRNPETIRDEILLKLGASDWLICRFQERGGTSVDVYVGYHEHQVSVGENGQPTTIHPPEHCMPGAGWDIVDSRIVPLDVPGLPESPAESKRFIIANGDRRALVHFWYQSRGRMIVRDSERLAWRFWDRAVRSRTDGALVRIIVPLGRAGEANIELGDAIFQRFASAFVRELPPFLPD